MTVVSCHCEGATHVAIAHKIGNIFHVNAESLERPWQSQSRWSLMGLRRRVLRTLLVMTDNLAIKKDHVNRQVLTSRKASLGLRVKVWQ